MRRLHLATFATLVTAFGIAACATVDRPIVRSAEAQRELARLLDGRVAGQAQGCLQTFRTQDQIIVDENTILYRDGSRRIWRNDMRGPCNGLGRPGTAIVTRQVSGGSLCSGEIAQIIDTAGGFTVGSCSFGDFVPYNGPQRR